MASARWSTPSGAVGSIRTRPPCRSSRTPLRYGSCSGRADMANAFYVVGDIHGCARELDVLLRGLPLRAGDTVAFVGDYIDRGPESRAVIDLLLALRARDNVQTVFLRGH